MKARPVVVGVLAVVVLLAVPACAKKYQAERDGKDVGQAICDVRDADEEGEAQEALSDLNEALDELSSDVAVFTAEDRADIDENITDLVEHILQDNALLAQQDVTVLRRSLDNIRDDLGDAGAAAIDGLYQGLDECLDG